MKGARIKIQFKMKNDLIINIEKEDPDKSFYASGNGLTVVRKKQILHNLQGEYTHEEGELLISSKKNNGFPKKWVICAPGSRSELLFTLP